MVKFLKFQILFKFIDRCWYKINTKHENVFSISLESEQKQDRA